MKQQDYKDRNLGGMIQVENGPDELRPVF